MEMVFKTIWKLAGIASIAVICWCFWEIESSEVVLVDMIWLLLSGTSALAAACLAFRTWERYILHSTNKDKRS